MVADVLIPAAALDVPVLPLASSQKFTMPHKMRAVVYDKPFYVSVKQVDKPKISHPDDIIVKSSLRFPFARKQLFNGELFRSYYLLHLWKVSSG
jgi:hypothetical protein